MDEGFTYNDPESRLILVHGSVISYYQAQKDDAIVQNSEADTEFVAAGKRARAGSLLINHQLQFRLFTVRTSTLTRCRKLCPRSPVLFDEEN